MKFLADIEVEEGLKDSSGDLGSNGQVLSSTGSGTNWITSTTGVTSLNTNTGAVTLFAGTNITLSNLGNTITINASGGGGIGGSITAAQVAFGATTTDEITGGSTFTYSDSGGIEELFLGDATSGQQTNFNLSHPNVGATRARYNLYAGTGAGSLKGYFQSTGTAGEVTLLSVANLNLDCGSTADIIMTSSSTAKVGIGNTSPGEKLDVTGRIKASKGVQVGTEADGDAAAGLVGTIRYYEENTGGVPGTRYSYTDMCMRTDTSTYEWVNIVTNRW